MNEKDVGDALLRWAGSVADPDETIRRVLRRDHRRVRRLAGATAALWPFAVAGIPLFFGLFAYFILPKANLVLREMITHDQGYTPEHLTRVAEVLLLSTAKLGILLVSGSVLVLLLAAWATVGLVFASRRATLRQVNANLLKIESQLR